MPIARCWPRASPSSRSAISAATRNAADADAPTWRDRWDDRQRLPLLVRIDVKPVKGAPWPTLVVEPRARAGGGLPGVGPGDASRCLQAGGR